MDLLMGIMFKTFLRSQPVTPPHPLYGINTSTKDCFRVRGVPPLPHLQAEIKKILANGENPPKNSVNKVVNGNL